MTFVTHSFIVGMELELLRTVEDELFSLSVAELLPCSEPALSETVLEEISEGSCAGDVLDSSSPQAINAMNAKQIDNFFIIILLVSLTTIEKNYRVTMRWAMLFHRLSMWPSPSRKRCGSVGVRS